MTFVLREEQKKEWNINLMYEKEENVSEHERPRFMNYFSHLFYHINNKILNKSKTFLKYRKIV